MTYIDEAIQIKPEPNYYLLRGQIFANLYEEKNKAICDYSEYIDKQNSDVLAYILRAQAYTNVDNCKAKDDYDKIIELSPGYEHHYYLDRGRIKDKINDYLGALQDFVLKGEKHILNEDDLIFMGDMCVKLENIDEAVNYFNQALHKYLRPWPAHFYHFKKLLTRLTKIGRNEYIKDVIDMIDAAYKCQIEANSNKTAHYYCQRGQLYAYAGWYYVALFSIYSAYKLDKNNLEYKKLMLKYDNIVQNIK